jgi:hypothetical protein
MATKKRKKEDVNREATEEENSFSSLSLSPFFLHITTFFLRHSLTLGFFGSCVRHPTTANGFHPHENRKEKRGNNVVTTSMFIDTLAFLLTRKLVGKHKKKKKKDSHLPSTTKENCYKDSYTFSFYILSRSCFLFFPALSNNKDDDDVIVQSIVPIELRSACG